MQNPSARAIVLQITKLQNYPVTKFPPVSRTSPPAFPADSLFHLLRLPEATEASAALSAATSSLRSSRWFPAPATGGYLSSCRCRERGSNKYDCAQSRTLR